MDWKEIFRPTISKIIIFLILMAGLIYSVLSDPGPLDAVILSGLPFGFYPVGSWNVGFYTFEDGSIILPHVGFSYVNFGMDIIFWYLFSCILVNGYKTLKTNKLLAIISTILFFTILFLSTLLVGWLPHMEIKTNDIMVLISITIIVIVSFYLLIKSRSFFKSKIS